MMSVGQLEPLLSNSVKINHAQKKKKQGFSRSFHPRYKNSSTGSRKLKCGKLADIHRVFASGIAQGLVGNFDIAHFVNQLLIAQSCFFEENLFGYVTVGLLV
jgi:hypothetical protein